MTSSVWSAYVDLPYCHKFLPIYPTQPSAYDVLLGVGDVEDVGHAQHRAIFGFIQATSMKYVLVKNQQM